MNRFSHDAPSQRWNINIPLTHLVEHLCINYLSKPQSASKKEEYKYSAKWLNRTLMFQLQGSRPVFG
jgi:hypothetical protein